MSPRTSNYTRGIEEYETKPISRHVEWRPRRGMPLVLGRRAAEAGHYVCRGGRYVYLGITGRTTGDG